MKINKNILLLFVALPIAFSCNKVLEKNPENTLNLTGRYKTIEDYQFSLTGAYSLFRQANYYGNGSTGAFSTMPDIMSDNLLETTASLANYSLLVGWAYASNDDNIQGTWLNAYSIIGQANLTLSGGPGATPIDEFVKTDADKVNRIKGQCYAIRGLVHFDLLRYFVDDYDRNSTKPGIPYITKVETSNPTNKPARGTVKTSYDAIENDLKLALNLLSGFNSANRYSIDFVGVNAILARMYLYSKQPDSAIKYASAVIASRPLATIKAFPAIWKDDTKEEVIFAANFNAGEGSPGSNLYFVGGNRSSFRMHSVLASLYNQTNDVRYSAYTGIINSNGGNPRRVVTKYLGKGSFVDGVTDFKVFRTAEMYLVRSEAYALRNTGTDAMLAVEDLNTLRNNRINGNTPLSLGNVPAILAAIQDERRRELFAEGHRWFDLKRTTRTIDRNPDCTSSAASPGTVCELAPNSRSWTWPIPQDEIDVNPNILPQNPGY